jgi:pimeloyl-ACP methyl ester carboxylesterase
MVNAAGNSGPQNTMQMTSITTPRGTFGAYRFGPTSAPAVIALHGFPDTARSWRPVGDLLAAQGFHVIAPYLRGYAPSPLEGPFDVDSLADDLATIVDVVSPGAPVVLAGHDWGAVIAYIALLRHPALFRVAITLAVPHPLAFLESLARTPSESLRSRYSISLSIRHVVASPCPPRSS